MKYLVTLFLVFASAAIASAKVVTKPVAYEHAGVKLEGFLAYDDATSAERPGVLVVHEWWGLNAFVRSKAEQLAAQGYVAFALDMYGAGVVTTDPKKAGDLAGPFYGKPLMAERARAGLEELLKVERVDKRRIAAIGFCFGGTTCQALAYSGAPLAGIVSFHGNLIPLSPEAAPAVKAKFLILHGAVDPFIKPDSIAAFEKSLESAKIDYQFVSYAGAIHAFTNPEADKIRVEAKLDGVGYNEPAARRSWQHMRLFFDELFGAR